MGRNSDYGSGMYQQLMDIMGRLETVEKIQRKKIDALNNRIETLEKNHALKEENRLLKEDNARLRSIINNNSSNTSRPPLHRPKRRETCQHLQREEENRTPH